MGGMMLALSILFLISCRSWGETSPIAEKKRLPVGSVVLFGILSLLHERLVRRPDGR